jgi:cephalosporin hydroxylase
MNELDAFNIFVEENIKNLAIDQDLRGLTNIWIREAIRHSYAHNFTWLGRPIIQTPQDIYAIQELIWKIKPDLVIETGIAHGGSLVLSASILAMIEMAEADENKILVDPRNPKRKVIGIDIDIREHNRVLIEKHPLNSYIEMIEGSSIDINIIKLVMKKANFYKNILVMLDSNHTHEHVLSELRAYAPLVTKGSYCIVWDSGIEDLPVGFIKDKPWRKGSNPKTAIFEYLKQLSETQDEIINTKLIEFEIDKNIESKIMITAATDGFLKRL